LLEIWVAFSQECQQSSCGQGISAIRCGGSFASVTAWPDGGGGTPPSDQSGEYYQWQKWTGPVWQRPSIGAVWNAYSGNSYSLIGGCNPHDHCWHLGCILPKLPARPIVAASGLHSFASASNDRADRGTV